MSNHLACSTRLASASNLILCSSVAGASTHGTTCKPGGPAVGRAQCLRNVLLLILLVGVCLQGAHAQEPSPEALLQRGKRHGASADLMRAILARGEETGLPSETIAKLLRLGVNSAQNNLPATPLLLTILEGFSKQVPIPQLTSALATFQKQFETAAHLVARGPSASPQESEARLKLIENVAYAHRRGLSWATVRQLHHALLTVKETPPPSVLAAAFEVVPTLSGHRSSPKSIRRLLVAALAKGYGETDIRKLPDVLSPASSAHPPSVALRTAIRAVERGRPLAEMNSFASTTAPRPGPFGMTGPPMDLPPGLGLRARIPGQRPEAPPPPHNPGPP